MQKTESKEDKIDVKSHLKKGENGCQGAHRAKKMARGGGHCNLYFEKTKARSEAKRQNVKKKNRHTMVQNDKKTQKK